MVELELYFRTKSLIPACSGHRQSMKMEESKTFVGTDFTDYTVKTGGIPQSRKNRIEGNQSS